uniref:Uncharacterized protein n=1 Tax=Arundo donax TaxID=35708 RepID=A0A0A9GWL7_ARUDO
MREIAVLIVFVRQPWRAFTVRLSHVLYVGVGSCPCFCFCCIIVECRLGL